MTFKIGRKDGIYLKKVDPFMRFFPFIMKKRNESAVYFKQQIDITRLRQWLSQNNRDNYREFNSSSDGVKSTATYFHVLVAALVQTMQARPQMNRFICGRRLYQRRDISAAFVIKREFNDEAAEEIIVMRFSEDEGLKSIASRIRSEVKRIRQQAKADDRKRDGILNWFNTLMNFPRPILSFFVAFLTWLDYHGWLPGFVSSLDPMHSSIFISNLGSLDIDAPFHHLYEWGTTSIFLTIGAAKKVPVVTDDNMVEAREVIDLAFTIDERISDGYYYAKSIKMLQDLLENPEKIRQ